MPQVSIIIAIYNVGQYLEKCLESAAGQSFKDLEIIAVNDGSTDASGDILQNFRKKDPRLLIVNKPNGGLSDARNAGMAVATGRYIAFLDGDDSYDPDFISKMVYALNYRNADLVCCNYAYTYENVLRKQERNYLRRLPLLLSNEEALAAFLREEIIASVAIKIFKREIIGQHAIRFPKGQLWEDVTFTFEYLKYVTRVAIVKEPLYNYFQGEGSITRTKETLNILDFIGAAKSCIHWVKENYKDKYGKENTCFFTRAYICLLVYSFKCKDPGIRSILKEELKRNSPMTGLYLLRREEKAMVLLSRIHYRLARFAYLRIHKQNKRRVAI